ncbi:MAG: hypothetical protein E6G34_11255 [Actinobacteria bacterium]|nr:MAG: hypothetical protein E6G34_11255 [Actinomycetota bacterium]
MRVRDRGAEQAAEHAGDQDDEPRRIVFRAVSVFDVAQTEPLAGTEPVSLEPPAEPIDGDSHGHLLAPLQQLAHELGYRVSIRPPGGAADGWCDQSKREIVVNARLAHNGQVRALVHELAHALGIGYREHGRRRAEVIVDTVTFIVCSSVGLDTSGSTVSYVAGWGEDGDLDAIRGCAEAIDQIARRIEETLSVRSQALTDEIALAA